MTWSCRWLAVAGPAPLPTTGVGISGCGLSSAFTSPSWGYSCTLLNTLAHTPAQRLISWSCQRYFTERTFEEAKTEIGWNEFQAQKHRTWEHHLALTALALWFVAQTKWEWTTTYARDPQLAQQLAVEVLPALSTANVRELLKAVLPLPQLTLEQATEWVITHLVNRARSIRSRWEEQNQHRAPP